MKIPKTIVLLLSFYFGFVFGDVILIKEYFYYVVFGSFILLKSLATDNF